MKLDDLDISKIQRIGLDKIRLSNLAIAGEIDFHRLKQDGNNVEIQPTADKQRRYRRYIPGTHDGIAKIIIKDNQLFSDLIIGCARDSNGLPIEYVYLTFTVTHIKGCNLENMTHEEYSDYIESVMNYIAYQYGIVLLYDCVKLDYAEINANIILNHKFSQYKRVLKLLMCFFNNHLGKLSGYEDVNDQTGLKIESYKRGNKSKEVIFYDKTQELEDMGNGLEDNVSILRIELRLKDKKKIKSVFGSCLWWELDDRKIAEYFHQEIYTQLFVRFNKWQSIREKELKKLIKDCRKESSKKWHDNVMHEIKNLEINMGLPYILDIEQVCNAFRKLPDPYNNANRSIKSLSTLV